MILGFIGLLGYTAPGCILDYNYNQWIMNNQV